MPLILMQLAEALCLLVDSRSSRVPGRISHTRAPGRRRDGTQEASDIHTHTAIPAEIVELRPRAGAISIHGLFHPQLVLLSLCLNCYELQHRHTHAARTHRSSVTTCTTSLWLKPPDGLDSHPSLFCCYVGGWQPSQVVVCVHPLSRSTSNTLESSINAWLQKKTGAGCSPPHMNGHN